MSSETPAASTEAPADNGSDLASRLTFPEKKDEETPKSNEASELAESQADGPFNAPGGTIMPEPEYDVQVTLADMQADPNNPLFSVKSFNQLDLPEALVKGILQMNFRKPSKIQERALPLLLMDPPTNLIAQSQSGTGKTAAFMLNILKRVDLSVKAPQAIVLAPSRELARQTLGVCQTMGQFLEGLEAQAVVPDPSKRGQKYTGQVLVGTAGSMMDMLRRKNIDARAVKILVLDEADNMLDMQGMGDQCTRVKAMLPRDIQIVLFSATFPTQVVEYSRVFAPKANQITLKHDELTVDGIKQLFLDCDGVNDKYETLLKFYGLLTIASSIIFVKTRKTAEELEQRMTKEGHHVAQLSGALEGSERDRIIDKFRSGEAKVLITTNVLARGIDVQSVTMVINYDIPEMANGAPDPETYLHRIGRTGRFGRVGVAISFVHDRKSWTNLMEIAKYFSVEIQPLPTGDWEAIEEAVKRVIKSSRAGKSTAEMQMDS